MQAWSVRWMGIVRAFAIAWLAVSAANGARAQAVDFNTFLSGGGGGGDPRNQKIARSSGAYVCMSVQPGASPDSVTFTIWSRIPQPNARIAAVAFDTGRYASLFTGVAVAFASPGVNAKVIPAQPHAFLPRMNPSFWIDINPRANNNPQGLGPGKMVAVTAKLATGKTIQDVVGALRVGLNPATGANGLRVGIIANNLLGGPPPGVATIMDDGGFLMT